MEFNDYIPHLKELRNRLIIIAIFFVISFFFCYYFSNDILTFVLKKGTDAGYNFVYLEPQEILVQQLKLDAMVALIISLPIIISEVALFVAPAVNSIWQIILPIFFGTIMFIVGAAFAYYVLLPFVFYTLYDLGITSGITAQVSVSSYVSLYLTLLISIGIIFELPLVSLGFTKANILNSNRMKKGRKVAIVIALTVAALITPPDVFSQLIVAAPIIILYEFSIRLCKLAERGTKCELES